MSGDKNRYRVLLLSASKLSLHTISASCQLITTPYLYSKIRVPFFKALQLLEKTNAFLFCQKVVLVYQN